MTVTQTVTATKAGAGFEDFEDAKVQYTADANASALAATLNSAGAGGDFTVVVGFNPATQTMTVERTWTDDDWAAYLAEHDGARQAAKANLEAAGWTTGETIVDNA